MKKSIIFVLIGLVIVGILLVSLFIFMRSEYYIKYEIKKANYCDTKDDCVFAGGGCPFGCYIYVNKNERDRIKNLVESFNSKCVYGCLYCPDFECKDNKCEPICE